ncbi:MAG: 4Fe-4S binding protein [Thermodesulfobacteriota bacterium]
MVFMLPVVFGNLFGGRATRPYPARPRLLPPRVRGRLVNDPSRCLLCGTCARVCPARCLEIDRDRRRWRHAADVCVYCGVCVENCPAGSLSQETAWPQAATVRERVDLPVPERPRKQRDKKSESKDNGTGPP